MQDKREERSTQGTQPDWQPKTSSNKDPNYFKDYVFNPDLLFEGLDKANVDACKNRFKIVVANYKYVCKAQREEKATQNQSVSDDVEVCELPQNEHVDQLI